MKKVVVILSALICFMLNNLVSQAENKLLTNDKIWHVDIGSSCPEGDNTGCFCYHGYITYKTGNVISINGKQYTEIIANNIGNLDEWNIQAYLREENNRIYFYSEKCGQEYLMYDFNLKTGDQVNLMDCMFPNCDMDKQDEAYLYTVTDVDSVYYNHKQYKRILLKKGNWSFSWIEGIGDIMGVLYHVAGWSGAFPQLKDCYEAGNQVFFNDNPRYCFITSLRNTSKNKYMSFFNDVKKTLHVMNAKNKQICLYNMTGQKMKSFCPDTDEFEISLSDLPDGLYLVSGFDINVKIIKL